MKWTVLFWLPLVVACSTDTSGALPCGADEYSCTCAAGFSGTNCDVDINECIAGPCEQGTCSDLVNGYSCACFSGWEGSNCDVDTDDCAVQPCQNGAECRDRVDGYRCNCAAGSAARPGSGPRRDERKN